MGGWQWWWIWVYEGCPLHTCMHMHVEHDKHGCLHVGGHLHVCVCVHMHVRARGDTPMPPDAPTHLPPPQSHREPKTPKFNKSLTNRDNWILFEDSLDYSCSPWIPLTHLPHPLEPMKPKSDKLQ